MLMHRCMSLAFVAAALAYGRTSLQQWDVDINVVNRLTPHHSGSSGTDIGAVQAEADTTFHLDIAKPKLGQVCVDVYRTSVRTLIHRTNDRGEDRRINCTTS
jgi:hypothetical protein